MVRKLYFLFSSFSFVLIAVISQFWPAAVWSLMIITPLVLLGLYDISQKRTLPRIYPVIGRLRYLFEAIRPEIQQYFVESDTNGQPVSREFRSLVYQRAKGVRDTRPFGTQFDVYRSGYEWMNQSLMPTTIAAEEPRVKFGGDDCTQPYFSSRLNISAMSYGALSRNAILALNRGAEVGGFAHNTGEGGISSYHLQSNGDIIWQIGTGYFGCRTSEGKFDSELFAKNAANPQVKMIEIKLSQGAKPGHGGILPASKLTAEIAEIRNVPMGADVVSPPTHNTFDTPEGLLNFVSDLRKLSAGKPVGFKLCIGKRSEFLAICKAMLSTGITPDFITIDGAEGGTGAAPIELTNSVGTPVRDGLYFVHNTLVGIGLRDQVRIIVAGKIMSAFHLVRMLALGADTVNSARAMMFALGCIQSRQCNANTCPTGVATQDPARFLHLNVEDKAQRVSRYQKATIHGMLELVATAGLNFPSDIQGKDIYRRISGPDIKSYAELYPAVEKACLLNEATIPEKWVIDWKNANASYW